MSCGKEDLGTKNKWGAGGAVGDGLAGGGKGAVDEARSRSNASGSVQSKCDKTMGRAASAAATRRWPSFDNSIWGCKIFREKT
jgi:hypothetical protein